MTSESVKPKDGRGDFFAIDKKSWPLVLDLGLNAAVAYLVLARGTGGDQKTTSWSVQAVEKYTAISRPRARIAIDALLAAKLLKNIETKGRPRYEIIHRPKAKDGKADLVWMPNSLIDGVPGNLAPPVELVRQTQNLGALKLLVELYALHDLRHGAGVDWRGLYEAYDRKKITERQEFTIWCFTQSTVMCYKEKPPAASFMTGKCDSKIGKNSDLGVLAFWAALEALRRIGLVKFVPHVVESDSDDAEIFAPMFIDSESPAEFALADSAERAAERMIGMAFAFKVNEETEGLLIPLPRHLENAQMVGIARLTYRPKTTATAAWLARADEWTKLAKYYDGIANPSPTAKAA